MNQAAMFQLSYGLFVLSAKNGEKDNGCIVNTVQQITTTPNRISIAVNKDNFTHDMIKDTGSFNVSILSEEVTFDIFKHFGFQSGRDVDKLKNFSDYERSSNGIFYLNKYANAFLSASVAETVDLGTHTMFIADVKTGKFYRKFLLLLTPTTINTSNRSLRKQKRQDGGVKSAVIFMKARNFLPISFVQSANMALLILSVYYDILTDFLFNLKSSHIFPAAFYCKQTLF